MATRRARLEFYEDSAGEWRWRFKAANGLVVAVSSEGYKRKRDAINGWRVMRESLEGYRYGIHFIDRPI